MMNVFKFKRKSINAAVLAGLGAVGVAGTAGAVHVNPDGLGQALIYPYYTVRSGVDTYLSVVNTTASVKAVKVRFLEGKRSREVLDFNLYLSPFDVWTGAVVATADGAKLVTADKSCTSPAIPSGGVAFRNALFSTYDGEDGSLDRTREGHIEIIEMGDYVASSVTTSVPWGVTHVNGVPRDCGVLTGTAADIAAPDNVITVGAGGMSGTAALMNVANGTQHAYDAVALDAFSAVSLWNVPGNVLPNMASVNPKYADQLIGNLVVSSCWAGCSVAPAASFTHGTTLVTNTINNADPVSATLMASSVINEFVLDTATLSATDWVVTFPTKWAYIRTEPTPGTATVARITTAADRPFVQNFGNKGSCDGVGVTVYDREETTTTAIDFSPSTTTTNSLCWEANVITFNSSALLASKNQANLNVSYQNGWARLSFDIDNTGTVIGKHGMLSGDDTVATGIPAVFYHGLPAAGFMVHDYVNGNVGGLMSNYGGNFNHKSTRFVSPSNIGNLY